MGVSRVVRAVAAVAFLAAACSSAPATPARRQDAGQATVATAWKGITTPELAANSGLRDVSATGPKDAWAVGHEDAAENDGGVAVLWHWNGVAWEAAPVPPASKGRGPFLWAVSAERPDSVWTVGMEQAATGRVFASHWDGRRWTVRYPFGRANGYFPMSVTAADGKAWFAGGGPSGGVVTEWDGRAFRVLRSGVGGGGSSVFNAISVKDGQLWAVGSLGDLKSPLIHHEVLGDHGSGWSETPDIPLGELKGVWQSSPSDVWAVGTVHSHGDNGNRPLLMHFDGSRWSTVRVPILKGELHDVTALGENDVWISGVDADHAGQVLFLHYDGMRWTREYSWRLRSDGFVTADFLEDGGELVDEGLVNRTSITHVPGTTNVWTVGSSGPEDDSETPERHFVLRR
ncbi:hypothetical protein [Nonomuraea wenchangensis]|uniref:hypothetical protein n=1 Tax=Nonomuraea wenchangensis TaxID=568860 RepID=UPI0037904DA1